MILKVALVLVGGHLLFGAVLLVVDAVYGINDENFSFVLVLLFSYLNFSGWWLLKFMGAEFNVVLMILAGLPQWIALSGIVGGVVSLVRIKKAALPPNENDVAISI
jgi:hypothetical protein